MVRSILTVIAFSFLQCLVPVLLAQDGNGGNNAGNESTRLPNFIIVFCDDMGYADIGPFGAEGYQTPHLDRIASK